MGNEVCENCRRTIGKLEQAFIHKGHIVCKQCNEKLQDERQELELIPAKVKGVSDISNSNTPKPLPQKHKPLRTTRKTRSKTLWLAFGGWCAVLVLLILYTIQFYSPKTTEDFFPPDRRASEVAAGCWVFGLMLIWFLGALPLFIAAVVTQKDKK